MRTAVLILSVICLAYFTPCKVSAYRDDLFYDEGSGDASNTTLKLTPPHEGSGLKPHDDVFYDEEDFYEDDYNEYPEEEYKEDPMYDGSAFGPIPDHTHVDEEDPVQIPKEEIALPEDKEEATIIENKEPYFEEPIPEETIPEAPSTEGTNPSGMDDTVLSISSNNDERQVSLFAQPAMLAAFVGGTVLGLLCAILLVMCIVYRMRKRDEGSYPLDETKRLPLTSSYAANDKEIYA